MQCSWVLVVPVCLGFLATAAEQVSAKVPAHTVRVYAHSFPEKNTWFISAGQKKIAGCSGGPYGDWYNWEKTECKLPTGSYTLTCCDKKYQEGWTGGYISIAARKYCDTFVFNAKKACHTTTITLAPPPTPKPTPNPKPKVSFKLTPCGGAGWVGPSQDDCDRAYGRGKVQVGAGHHRHLRGYQVFVVPKTGTYRFNLAGARGGNHGNGRGGFGARAKKKAFLKKGDKLVVVIGQKGSDNPINSCHHVKGGGGGGATFLSKIVKSGGNRVAYRPRWRVKLLAAAGGGAGMQCRRNRGQAHGGRADQGHPHSRAVGGMSGGGGGYFRDGAVGDNGQCAQSFFHGADGGLAKRGGFVHNCGGFGGGGQPYNGGGGGGGYDGGDCSIGGTDHDCYGGSSFGDVVQAAVNRGDGFVDIMM